MVKLMLSLLLLVSFNSGAASKKLSPDEFLKLIDRGKISFQVAPPYSRQVAIAVMMGIDPSIKDVRQIPESMLHGMAKSIEKNYQETLSYFHPEMLNIRYVDDKPYRYSITFDFLTTRKCTLRVDKLDMSCGNPICDDEAKDPSSYPGVDLVGTVIDDKYCEQVYGIKIDK